MKNVIKLVCAVFIAAVISISCSDEGNLNPASPETPKSMDTFYGAVIGYVYYNGNPQNGATVYLWEWVDDPFGLDYWWYVGECTTPIDVTSPGSYGIWPDHNLNNKDVRLSGYYGLGRPATKYWKWIGQETVYEKDLYITSD